MRIFVINLQRSPQRRQHMRDQLEALQLPYEFFDAIDAGRGQLAGVSRYDEAQAIRVTGQTLQPGECGCYASHFVLWQRCVELGEPIVIMEDDVLIAPGLRQVMQQLAPPLQHFGFVRLAGLWQRPYRVITALNADYDLVRYWNGPVGTQCYAISPAGAAALLQHAQVWVDAVDRYLDRFWTHGLDSYAILPFQVSLPQEALASEIEGRSVVYHSRSRHRLMRLRHRCARYLYNIRYRFTAGRSEYVQRSS